MAVQIAPNTMVDPQAEIDVDVEIGPFCVIGPKARVGRGTRLENNVTLMGNVTLGCENHIYPGAVIGGAPQDMGYQGSDTRLVIGDHNVIREGVTINLGSEKESRITAVGNHCLFMAGSHIAHDCNVGNQVVIANGTMLGGHVHIQDHATLSGAIGVHHFVTIGRYSFVGGMSSVRQDVPPFMLAEGCPARPRCVNVVALKRNDFPADVVKNLAEAHRLLFRSKVGIDQARQLLRNNGKLIPQVNELFEFLETQQEGRHGRARELRRAA